MERTRNQIKLKDFYRDGFSAQDMLKAKYLKGEMLIVEPIQPKDVWRSVLGLSDDAAYIPGTAAMAFRVLRIGDTVTLPVKQDDIVLLRNAAIDPLVPTADFLIIEQSHILLIMEPEDIALKENNLFYVETGLVK